MRTFKDKVAVITGAASGMGRATARALAREGVHVVVADIHDERAAETAAMVEACGVAALVVHCDVGEAADIAALRQAAIDRFGRVNILMNNAGVLPVGSIEDLPPVAWERTMRINFHSVVLGVQTFLADLRAADEAHIVNTASYAGLISYGTDTLAYNASKAAVVSLSEGLAVYLRPRGIGVTCLCPGPVTTNIREQITLHGEMPEALGTFAVKTSEGRTADEVGAMVVAAIRANRFLLPTDERMLDQIRDHGADPEGFIGRIIEVNGS